MTTAKFKQPIVFQSRVIDLSEVEKHITGYMWDRMEAIGAFSCSNRLHTYFIMFSDMDPDGYSEFLEQVKESVGVDFEDAKYGKLQRPLALDMCSGELHQIASVEYSRSGEVMSVIVRDGDSLKYIYNAIPEYGWIPPEALKTELQIMYDGWQ